MLQLLDNPLHYLQLPHLQHSPRIQRNHHPAVISAQGWPSNWLFFTRTSHPCESVLKIFKFLVKCQQPKRHLNLDMCFSRPTLFWNETALNIAMQLLHWSHIRLVLVLKTLPTTGLSAMKYLGCHQYMVHFVLGHARLQIFNFSIWKDRLPICSCLLCL